MFEKFQHINIVNQVNVNLASLSPWLYISVKVTPLFRAKLATNLITG